MQTLAQQAVDLPRDLRLLAAEQLFLEFMEALTQHIPGPLAEPGPLLIVAVNRGLLARPLGMDLRRELREHRAQQFHAPVIGGYFALIDHHRRVPEGLDPLGWRCVDPAHAFHFPPCLLQAMGNFHRQVAAQGPARQTEGPLGLRRQQLRGVVLDHLVPGRHFTALLGQRPADHAHDRPLLAQRQGNGLVAMHRTIAGVEQVQRCATGLAVQPDDQRVASLTINTGHLPRNRRIEHQLTHGKLHAGRLADTFLEHQHQQRVPAQLEEVVLHPHLFKVQDLTPGEHNGVLQRIARRHEVPLMHTGVRRRQGLAV